MNIHRYRFYMHSVREKCVDHKSSRCMLMLAALGYSTVISSQGPIIQMSSLMHHISTPRTGMHNPNQCSTLSLKCQGHSDLLSVHNSYGAETCSLAHHFKSQLYCDNSTDMDTNVGMVIP